MNVLITGAPGWLGTRFVEWLIARSDPASAPLAGARVRLLVLPGADLAGLQPVQGRIEVVSGDLRDPAALPPTVAGVDCVFHLAGIIHPTRIRDLYALNTEGTRQLLEAAIAAHVRRFVYVSSNSVGGFTRSPDPLMVETDAPRPYMNYGRSKWLAEQLVHDAGRRGAIETVVLRPCWYYGTGQPARQTRFFQMIQQGHPVLFGNGHNLRSLTYLDNLCQALVLAATRPQAVGQTYWIADERPYPTIEIYETVARLLNVQALRPRKLPGLVSEGCLMADAVLQRLGCYITEIHVAGEMNKHIACSVAKAQRELGYHPQVALEEGMRRSIAWCRAHGVAL